MSKRKVDRKKGAPAPVSGAADRKPSKTGDTGSSQNKNTTGKILSDTKEDDTPAGQEG